MGRHDEAVVVRSVADAWPSSWVAPVASAATLALGLADAGADVVATGRRADLVGKVADEIEARGRRTLRLPADVSDVASLEALKARTVETLGDLHIMVVAAGITKRVPTLDMAEADWHRIIDTNLTGTLPRLPGVRRAHDRRGATAASSRSARCRRSWACSKWRPTWRASRRWRG